MGCVCPSVVVDLFFFKEYFIDYAITVIPFFSPFYLPLPCTPPPASIPPLSSCQAKMEAYIDILCFLVQPKERQQQI